MMINLRSDNESPVAAPILDAVVAANTGFAAAYGDDPISAGLTARFSALFETPVTVYPVATGTAANALVLSHLCPPYGAVFCHDEAHINTDECGAPEFFTGGAKLIPIAGPDGLITVEALSARLARTGAHGIHESQPAVLSLTQASELGRVYPPDHLKALCDRAHGDGLKVHMDGARFANALVHLGCSPADLTWRAGVDALAFGATKNGAMAAEAVVLFTPEPAAAMPRRRKRAGHLFSKMRYLSAQLDAYLTDDLWLTLARQANRAAARLADGLTAGAADGAGVEILYPVEANELFVAMPAAALDHLEQAGVAYYRWPTGAGHARLVCSHATTDAEVDRVIALVREAAVRS